MHNLLKFIIVIVFSNLAYAQEFYTYKLFDNKFQAVFPGNPSIQEIPKELLDPIAIEKSLPYEYKKELSESQIKKIVLETIKQMKASEPYIYIDNINKISFTSQSLSSNLEHKNYIWDGIQKQIDEILKSTLKADNRKLIDFSSTLDKKNNTYIALYTSYYLLDGQKVYSSTKQIYFKDKIYKWSVSYIDAANRIIFDKYKENCQIIIK